MAVDTELTLKENIAPTISKNIADKVFQAFIFTALVGYSLPGRFS
jgi:hypothetical protein